MEKEREGSGEYFTQAQIHGYIPVISVDEGRMAHRSTTF